MTVSVLINNYNYRQYVGAAVASVLAQTRPADEIIVVDDGSTDGSGEVLQALADRHQSVRIIEKANGGQLSSINAAVRAASGDLFFFLDADDEYLPAYLETAVAEYLSHADCGYLFCAHERFDRDQKVVRSFPENWSSGLTVAYTRCAHPYDGSMTSTQSMRREVAAKFLPLPAALENDWRVRADDCLAWGAALAGAGKRYLDAPLVRYRVHGDNHHFGRSFSARYEYERSLRVNRLMRHFDRVLDLPPDIAGFCGPEFLSKPRPRGSELRSYLNVVWTLPYFSWWKRARLAWVMTRHFLTTRRLPVTKGRTNSDSGAESSGEAPPAGL